MTALSSLNVIHRAGASSTLPKLPAELQESLLKSLESPAGEAEAAEVVEAAATTEVPSAAPAESEAVAAPAKPVAADKPLKLSSKLTKRDLKAMLEVCGWEGGGSVLKCVHM